MRNLVLILGDQLSTDSAAFDGFDNARDRVWMAEVSEEATKVRSHKARIALFLSAMRHFRDYLRKRNIPVNYRPIDASDNEGTFVSELRKAVRKHKPEKLILAEPGEWSVRRALTTIARDLRVAIDIRPDRHFMCSTEEFAHHASSRKRLLMEHFYREMRRNTGILMKHGKPRGGTWNFDRQNRNSFAKKGPGTVPEHTSFRPDATTQEVMTMVKSTFAEHPGSLANFDWPVTARQAKKALDDFVRKQLPLFGPYQDAMWNGEPYLYHSRLSAALNLKLLKPQDVIEAALEALETGTAPLNSVEGFIRQILGWREYVRAIYWHFMPEYADRNELNADVPLPWFYWTAETDMNCLRTCVAQTLDYGYAHHIQRLMVTGLFALLLGIGPKEVHKWYLAMYVDAVEWVELPNTLGMSQFADGGVMATKPYAASGAYIQRMSNYCEPCRYEPSRRSGEAACPFTTLYWDFLMRNEDTLHRIPRMGMQLRNLERLDKDERVSIRRHADMVRKQVTGYTETAGKK